VPARARRARLDAELVRRGLVPSRDRAAGLIAAGRVRVAGTVATKAATAVEASTPLLVDEPPGPTYVSRGGHKLAGALDVLGVDPAGRRALDAGASTGGFTDVLLRRGAAHVTAVDVGYGQLAWSLRTDARVLVIDRVNVRALVPERLPAPVDLVVADLSFIPLALVLPALAACATPAADLLPMVKPQFEVGRARLPAGGVVREPALRSAAVLGVAQLAATLGLCAHGVTASPLPGPSGNVEYFLWLRREPGIPDEQLAAAIATAVADGPQ